MHQKQKHLLSSSPSYGSNTNSWLLLDNSTIPNDENHFCVAERKNGQEHQTKLDTKHERCIYWFKVIWSFISFLLSVADVTVIIYLAQMHFRCSSAVHAWLMLLPILLNFIGIFTFLSNDEERKEMEMLTGNNVVWKNLMFLPILGPSVSAFKLFMLNLSEDEPKIERLESLLTKMRQYESFFRAAPEAFVQITHAITDWPAVNGSVGWTLASIFLCIFALAESNMYSTVVPYYHIFVRVNAENAWRVDHIRFRWRVVLFLFAYASIETRIFADAALKSTVEYLFEGKIFGEVLIEAFIIQFVVRAILSCLFVWIVGSERQRNNLSDTGVYGAFTYAWRSLFMSFHFQSSSLPVFLCFYIENVVLITAAYVIIFTGEEDELWEEQIFHGFAIFSLFCMIFAIGLRWLIWIKLERSDEWVMNKPHDKD